MQSYTKTCDGEKKTFKKQSFFVSSRRCYCRTFHHQAVATDSVRTKVVANCPQSEDYVSWYASTSDPSHRKQQSDIAPNAT